MIIIWLIIFRANELEVIVQGETPHVTNGGFSENLCSVWVSFDMNIQADTLDMCAPENDGCCDAIFGSSVVSELGEGKF